VSTAITPSLVRARAGDSVLAELGLLGVREEGVEAVERRVARFERKRPPAAF
jgi:hypothetical protein